MTTSHARDHVLAQVDTAQSKSTIESVWSLLRHRWLYLHTLDSFVGLERLTAMYFADHNALIPRVELAVTRGTTLLALDWTGSVPPRVF